MASRAAFEARPGSGAATTAAAEVTGFPDNALELEIEELALDNGLRVGLHPDSHSRVAVVHLGYDHGSAMDPAGLSGLAHLCEHLSSWERRARGDEHAVPAARDLAEMVEEAGGVADARTSHDRTIYTTVVAPEHLDLALWTEARRLAAPDLGLDAESLEREREVVLREQTQTAAGRPFASAFRRIHGRLYPTGHGYHHLPIGTAEGVRRADLDAVRAGFHLGYRPQKATLVVAGPFGPEAIRDRVRELFGGIRAGATDDAACGEESAPCVAFPEHFRPAPEPEVVADRAPSARTYVGIRIPIRDPVSRVAPGLLARCLTLGRDLPLFRELVEGRGLASAIDAAIVTLRQGATLVLHATGARGVEEAELRPAFLEALDRQLGRPPEPAVLARARAKSATDHLGASQFLKTRAERLGARLAVGGDARG
ncbi:MAG: insulinase family protein, partial [Holophagales bacterium]|nr:insulinase family protein [Holophagales bacterium]